MDEELAYLAGFFDGEGYIGIHKANDRYDLRVSVTQLDPRPLLMFQARFGGSLHRAPDRRGFRSLIVWTIVAARAMAALRGMRPLLVVKAPQADAAFEFQEYLLHPGPDRAREIERRERIYQQIRDLKRQTYDDIELPLAVRVKQVHSVPRLRWAKPKPPKPEPRRQRKVSVPVRSTGYDRKKKPDAAMLSSVYADVGLTDAARHFGVSRQTIVNWLDSYSIPRQGRTEASEMRRKAAIARAWQPLA